MAVSINSSALLSDASVSEVFKVKNIEVRNALHKAHLATRLSLAHPESKHWKSQATFYLNEAQRLIRASLPIDYTPKKSVVDDWDSEPTFGQQPSKQEKDLEDFYLSSKIVSFRGKSHQSKSKAKWQRSGKQARVLSNR